MGKSMYNFVKRGEEKARQQKQLDKAARHRMAKQQKACLHGGTLNTESDNAEPELVKIVKTTA
jgi:hypothetical protein